MKKIIFALPIVLTLFMSACSSAASATEISDPAAASTLVADLVNQNLTASAPIATQTSSATVTIELNTTYENAVSVEMQLLLGTIKLEGTELAVTTEQANVLIPLWTNFKTLSQSMMPTQGNMGQGQPNVTPQPQAVNAETQAQIDELAKQIQAIMTPEQLTYIASLQITQETARTIMQEQGLTMGNPRPGDGQQAPQGDMFQGTPGTGPDGQFLTPPSDQNRQGNSIIPTELIDQLIQLLEKKAAS